MSNMRNALPGIIIGLAAIVVLGVASWYSHRMAGSTWHVRPTVKNIKDMPLQLGDWTAVSVGDVELEVFEALGAKVAEQRTYKNGRGFQVAYHGSVFEDFAPAIGHSPLDCYPANGWELLSMENKEVRLSDGTTFNPVLASFELNDEKVFVIFWFQFGPHVVTTHNELRSAFEDYRDVKEWPCRVKVMLQIPGSAQLESFNSAMELAAHIYEYTRNLQEGDAPVVKSEKTKLSDSETRNN